VPVQSALTVYVPGMDSWRTTSPLKLAEMTAFTLPLPSYFSIPAMANGFWLFPVTSTPSWASRYVPCSVALEHFALAPFSSSANPLPTATTPTTPTTPNTTNRAAKYLFMGSLYLLALSGPTYRLQHTPVRGVGVSLKCSIFVLNVIKRGSENSVRAKFAEIVKGEVQLRRIPLPRCEYPGGWLWATPRGGLTLIPREPKVCLASDSSAGSPGVARRPPGAGAAS